MRFLSPSFVALTVLVVGVGQSPAQKLDEAEINKRLAEVQKQINELRAKMHLLKAEDAKLTAEQARLSFELFKLEVHADRGAIQRLDVVDGMPQSFVLGRFEPISEKQRGWERGGWRPGPVAFRAVECTVRLRKDTRIMFSDKQQANPSDLQAGQWVRLRVKFLDREKSKAEADEIIIDKTARQIVGTISVGDLAKKVDFAKEHVVLFQWNGEIRDKMVFIVAADKEGPIVDFRFYPDLEIHPGWELKKARIDRDDDFFPPWRHTRIYAIVKDVRATGISDIPPGKRYTNAEELAKDLVNSGEIMRLPLLDGQKELDLSRPNQGMQAFSMVVQSSVGFLRQLDHPREGRTVLVDKDTQIAFSDKQKAKLSDLKTGHYVHVRARIVERQGREAVQADGIVIEKAVRRIYEGNPGDVAKQVDFTKELVLLYRVKSRLADDELMLTVLPYEKVPQVLISFRPAMPRGPLENLRVRGGSEILCRMYAIRQDALVKADVQGTKITSAEELTKVLQANP